MNIKNLIALLFLMGYMLVLTHNAIPHVHEAHEQGTFFHKHHSDSDSHQSKHHNHDHDIAHNDHLDEGFLDLIICILSEIDHLGENIVFNHYNDIDVASSFSMTPMDVASYSPNLSEEKIDLLPIKIINPDFLFESQHFNSSALFRGPPAC